MDTLIRLFGDYPLASAMAGVAILLLTTLPFARGKILRAYHTLGTTLASVVGIPFGYWKSTVIDLTKGTLSRHRRGSTLISTRVVPILQGVLVAGGLLILTAGIMYGWRASGFTRETGHLKSTLRSELPNLERTLADTRVKIAELDGEWETSRDCLVEETFASLFDEAGALRDERVLLAEFLANDRQTKSLFRVLREESAATRGGEIALRNLRADFTALGLPHDKVWLLTRFLDNRVRADELTHAIREVDPAKVRKTHQPEIETLRMIEAELPAAIARVRADLEAPDPGATFDAAAFVIAAAPALVLFCAFVWVMGGLIEMMVSGVPLGKRLRASINEEGHLNWTD